MASRTKYPVLPCDRIAIFYIALVCALYNTAYSKEVSKLTEDNWTDMNTGEWMVKFHAPWCPACRALVEPWKQFAGWSRDLDINVGEVDITENPSLSGRFMVTALPTVFHVKNGIYHQYSGPRDKEDFIAYVEEKKWQNSDPVPAWKDPTSFHMGAVAWFFRLSVMLRNIHSMLMEDYNLPYWAVYMIFATATIVVGSLLGLVIVCCIDCACPPKHRGGDKIDAGAVDDIQDDQALGDDYDLFQNSDISDGEEELSQSDDELSADSLGSETESELDSEAADDGQMRRRRKRGSPTKSASRSQGSQDEQEGDGEEPGVGDPKKQN